jgi:hypothetical protein
MPHEALEKAISSVRTALEVSGQDQRPEWSTELEPQLDEVRRAFSGEAIDYCLDRFIQAELDFESPGQRGLGRISEVVPRYGAHYRKHLRRLDTAQLDAVDALIRTQILSGYLAFVLPRESPVEAADVQNGENLFRQWIPHIYSSSLANAADEESRTLLAVLGSDAMQNHLQFLGKHGMKGGGFLSSDKTELILFHYHLAGFGLRIVERLVGRDE